MREKESATTPGYFALAAAGISLPPLPYYVNAFEDNGTVGTAFIEGQEEETSRPVSVRAELGGMHPVPTSILVPVGVADDKAKESFYGNSGAYESTTGVTMAELPKTVALIGNSAIRIAQTFKKLKRFDVKGAFEAISMSSQTSLRHGVALQKSARNAKRSAMGRLDFASNAWLEMTYGWKPLLSEIDNAARDLAYGWEAENADFRIHGSGSATGSSELVNTSRFSADDINVFRAEQSVRVGYTCHVKVIDPTWRALSALGILNPLEIGWELMPYSFVVDWFMPMGNWVASLDALVGLQFVDGSRSERRTQVYSGVTVPDATIGGEIWPSPVHYQASQKSFKRTVLAGPPPNDFIRMKAFSEAMSMSHSVSAIALLQNAFR